MKRGNVRRRQRTERITAPIEVLERRVLLSSIVANAIAGTACASAGGTVNLQDAITAANSSASPGTATYATSARNLAVEGGSAPAYVLNSLGSFVSPPDGAFPNGHLALDSSGNLFGTTVNGGAYGYGTVFEIVHGTTTITTLVSFDGIAGGYPGAGVTLDANGDLFGTTDVGGANNDGTVFEIVHGTTAITTLASFTGPSGITVGTSPVRRSGSRWRS